MPQKFSGTGEAKLWQSVMCPAVYTKRMVWMLIRLLSIWKRLGLFLKDYDAEGITHISNSEVLTTPCDVLVPAALENQITEENADKLQCSYIVEAANGPTSKEADAILEKARHTSNS